VRRPTASISTANIQGKPNLISPVHRIASRGRKNEEVKVES